MNCPLCDHPEHRVMRTSDRDGFIRRTRRCDRCGHSWATREAAEETIKRAGDILAKARELLRLAD